MAKNGTVCGDQNAIRRAAKAKQKHGVKKVVRETFSLNLVRQDQQEWNAKKREVRGLIKRAMLHPVRVPLNEEWEELVRLAKQWESQLVSTVANGEIVLGRRVSQRKVV